MSNNKDKVFHLNAAEVNQILFCDESDTEDALPLDDEDINFLESDMDLLSINRPNAGGQMEVVIEPSSMTQRPNQDGTDCQSTRMTTSESESPSTSSLPSATTTATVSTDTTFKWKKMSKMRQKALAEKRLQQQPAESEFGEILLELEAETTPYQVFEKIANFDAFLTDIVIPQTILYSQQKGHVFTTTVEEMRAFFGMQIVMGYHALPCIRDYWSTDPTFGVYYIANIMPLKRFEELRAYLHFNDNDLMKPRDHPHHDRAFKIRPVLDHFNKCFIAGMSATEEQAIDEHMIKFKGHNILRQYVKGKPVQWGFKLWCRCDSKTGYLFQFDLYTGKKSNNIEHGLGEGVVLTLTEQIRGLYCQVYIDNFFNSPQLQYNLLQNGILSAGTVRISRKNLPKSELLPSDKEMAKGDMVCMSSNNIFFTKWMDNKAVHMLSNFLGTDPISQTHRKSKGTAEKVAINCPAVVREYNKHMGGVDLMDQKKVTYQFDHRSKYKYYLRVVNDMIDIAVVNAEIIYNKVCDPSDKLDSKNYRSAIAQALIGCYSSRKREVLSSAKNSRRSSLKRHSNDTTPHTMKNVDKRQRCKLCTSNKIQNRTNNVCVECNVHLCFLNGRNCFALYHS